MTRHAALRVRPLSPILVAASVLSLGIWAGCGSDDNKSSNNGGGGGGGTTTSSFTGWLANSVENGSVAITVNKANLAGRPRIPNAPRAAVTASGTLTLSGVAPVALTGTLDDTSGDLGLSGGGYTLTGLYDPGPPSKLFGSYTGPNGNGGFDCESGGSASATVLCGGWTSSDQSDSGTFTFSIRGTTVEGIVYSPGASPPYDAIPFTGTVSGTGTTRTISVSFEMPNLFRLTASGTLDTATNTVSSGTYLFEDLSGAGNPDQTGYWSAAPCHSGTH